MSDKTKPIEAEVIGQDPQSQSQALVVRPSQEVAPPGLFGTQEPVAIIERATSVATALKAVIVKQGLISRISGKDYPKCEAWTLLGTMLGVFPVLCWSKSVEGGWEARVEARTKDGGVVGAAEAQCLRAERNWKDRDDFALRSMAQTRATAKCLRMPLGFVMTLAGYEPTPAEEMVADHPYAPPEGRREAKPPPTTSTPPPAASRPPAPAQAPAKPPPFPTEESRAKMIQALKAREGEPNRDIVTEFFRKLTDPTPLAPFEQLEELKLIYVPATQGQMKDLADKIDHFARGDRLEWPYRPHPEPPDPKKGKAAAPKQPELPKEPTKAPPQDPEWWRDIIVPIPPKGMKRDQYLKNPETIGGLYELRHEDTEEGAAARSRLWGFVNHFEPKPWTKRSGEVMPPSETDIKFREALDAFADYFEREHPGEKL